jgi:uncharacterized membrane protein
MEGRAMYDDRNKRDKDRFIKGLIIAFVLMIVGPAIFGIIGSIIIALLSVSFGLLVAALALIASPLLILLLPGTILLGLPAAALFFIGIGVLALFVLSFTLVIKIIKAIAMAIIGIIRSIFGRF